MRLRTACVPVVMAATAAGTYLVFGRTWCLTWGATTEDVERTMPGDDLLAEPDLVSTRAVGIGAPPSAVWPWIVQMGSGRGGLYSYDWIENILGLHMHSTGEILSRFQDRKVGDVEQLGTSGPRLRIEVLDAERALVFLSEDGNWVWAFCLYPAPPDRTTLVSRNRIAIPGVPRIIRVLATFFMGPGSLVMERKMLLGVKQRAERMQVVPGPVPT